MMKNCIDTFDENGGDLMELKTAVQKTKGDINDRFDRICKTFV